jgi:hypothetical protein
MTEDQARRLVTVHKEHDATPYGWGVFIDGQPFVTGLSRLETYDVRERAIAYVLSNEDQARAA